MFIGPRAVVKTHTRGLFHCPRCDMSRAYAYRRVRRFFAFLYVPVVPLADRGEFVQCGFCRHAFKPSILESGPSVDSASAETARRVGTAHRAAALRGAETELTGAAASTLLLWEAEGA